MKFELVKKYQNQSDLLPKRETKYSAGYDFRAAEDATIDGLKPVLIRTGVKAKLGKGQVLLMINRSSNPINRGLMLANGTGVIDADYYNNPKNEGEIMGEFMSICQKPVHITRGDRIMQGIVVNYDIAENDHAIGNRLGGFGSTGDK